VGLFGGGRPKYRSTNPNPLVASGERVRRRETDSLYRLRQPWQSRAFAYYDLLPEINYASQFYSRALGVLRLFAAERDAQGNVEETKNEQVIEQLERIQDPGGGGRSGLLGAYGRLMFLVGEALLFVTRDEDVGQEQWEMLSSDELRVIPGGSGYQRVKAPALAIESYRQPGDDDWEPIKDDGAVAYRLWRRHPRYSALATSTMQSVLDVAEELVLLTQAVRSRARSRLAGSGILIVNGRALPAPVEPVPDEDIEQDPFMRDLIDAMTAPITNEGAASSVVPHVVRVDPPDGKIDEVMKHLQIVDPMQLYPETGLRMECIKRLAIGLDMPPEILLGMTQASHWSAWMVDENAWKAHLQPVADQLVADLTSAFLQPTLREERIADWQRYVVAYDPARAINHPDRSKDAKDDHDRGVLSDQALRDATGFSGEDAPSEDERRVWIAVHARDPLLALTGEPTPAKETNAPPPAETGPSRNGDATTQVPGGTSPETERTPPPEPTEVGGDAVVSSGDLGPQAARVLGAADLALHRARELAGSRLRSYAKRDREAQKLIDGVRPALVPATLGRERARALRAPSERELVAGVRETLAEALRLWGVDDAIADPLADRVEQHAARTLFDARPAPLPRSFENYVRGLRLDEARA